MTTQLTAPSRMLSSVFSARYEPMRRLMVSMTSRMRATRFGSSDRLASLVSKALRSTSRKVAYRKTTTKVTRIEPTDASSEVSSRCRLICAISSWRSVAQVGSVSKPKNTATRWIAASSDSWYCGASASARSLLAITR